MLSYIGLIVFGVVIILALIEALIGVKRGLFCTCFRILFWAVTTFLAALIAKAVSLSILTKVATATIFDNGAETILEGIAEYEKAGKGFITKSFEVPILGIGLSASIPIVFVVIFILAKLISWILYIIFKAVIKGTAFGNMISERPTWSKITGGVLGFFVGIYSCAIILMPVTGLVSEIEGSDAVESVKSIAQNAIKIEDVYSENGLTEREKSDRENMLNEAEKIYNKLAHSPQYYISKFSGAQSLSNALYHSISKVSGEKLKVKGHSDMEYSFPETVGELLGIAEKAEKVVKYVANEEGLTDRFVDSIEDVSRYLLKLNLFTDEEKLDIINSGIETAEEAIWKAIGYTPEDTKLFDKFTSVGEFTDRLRDIFELVKRLAKTDWMGIADSLTAVRELKPEEILDNSQMLSDLAQNVIAIDNGAKVIGDVINGAIEAATEGGIKTVVSEYDLKNATAEELADTTKIITELMDYEGRTLTEQEADEVEAKLDELKNVGLINANAIEEVRKIMWIDQN